VTPVSAFWHAIYENIIIVKPFQKIPGVKAVFFLKVRPFFDNETQLKVNFYSLKAVLSLFSAVFHGKKLSY
jgi:hypothetical protein